MSELESKITDPIVIAYIDQIEAQLTEANRRVEEMAAACTHIVALYDAEGKAALSQKDMLWAMCVTAKKALATAPKPEVGNERI
jgi:hypothetical protein